jgi:Arc/MetJ family transcription regulator
MTRIQIDLPDATAQAASKAGLLTPEALVGLLNDALRREAGRKLLARRQARA